MAVILSSDLVLSETPEIDQEQPLNHARIFYQTFTRDATVTASSEQTNFEGEATKNPLTYERWKPSSLPATIEYQFDGSKDIDYVMIAAHTLGSNNCSVKSQYSHDGGATWNDADSDVKPADNKTLVFLFDEVTAPLWRVNILDGDAVPTVGVVYIGKALQMQRPIYGGVSPPNLARQTTIRPTSSERGQWLGRSVIRSGLSTSFSWQHLTADWYRKYFDPFVESARLYPFGIAWYPSKFPEEVAYVWTEDDITPSNMGIRNYMEVSMNVKGFSDG